MSVELDNKFKEEIKDLPKIWVYRISLNSDKGGIICDSWKEVQSVLKYDFEDNDYWEKQYDCEHEYYIQITKEEMFKHEFEELGEFCGW